MNKAIEIAATLTRNPYPNTPKLCAARTLPLATEVDFQSVSALPVNAHPVWLNYAEHYRLICELLTCIDRCERAQDTLLIRMQMPAGGRMPREFLNERILLLQDVKGEEAILQREGRSYWVIEDSLARHPLEAGNNTLLIRFSCPADVYPDCFELDRVDSNPPTEVRHGFNGLVTQLHDLGFNAITSRWVDQSDG